MLDEQPASVDVDGHADEPDGTSPADATPAAPVASDHLLSGTTTPSSTTDNQAEQPSASPTSGSTTQRLSEWTPVVPGESAGSSSATGGQAASNDGPAGAPAAVDGVQPPSAWTEVVPQAPVVPGALHVVHFATPAPRAPTLRVLSSAGTKQDVASLAARRKTLLEQVHALQLSGADPSQILQAAQGGSGHHGKGAKSIGTTTRHSAALVSAAPTGLESSNVPTRLGEPLRRKTHWDYALEEMIWMANDFWEEEKLKVHLCKRLAMEAKAAYEQRASRLAAAAAADEAMDDADSKRPTWSSLVRRYWSYSVLQARRRGPSSFGLSQHRIRQSCAYDTAAVRSDGVSAITDALPALDPASPTPITDRLRYVTRLAIANTECVFGPRQLPHLPPTASLSLTHTGYEGLHTVHNFAGKLRPGEAARAYALQFHTAAEAALSADQKTKLRAYQRSGLMWMHGMWRRGLPIVIADDRHLGKRPMVLAYVAMVSQLPGLVPTDATKLVRSVPVAPTAPYQVCISADGTDTLIRHGTATLVVAPPAAALGWACEARRWHEALRVHTYDAIEATTALDWPFGAGKQVLGPLDIVIVTPRYLKHHAEAVEQHRWRLVVADATVGAFVGQGAGLDAYVDPACVDVVPPEPQGEAELIARPSVEIDFVSLARVDACQRVVVTNRLLPVDLQHASALAQFLLSGVFSKADELNAWLIGKESLVQPPAEGGEAPSAQAAETASADADAAPGAASGQTSDGAGDEPMADASGAEITVSEATKQSGGTKIRDTLLPFVLRRTVGDPSVSLQLPYRWMRAVRCPRSALQQTLMEGVLQSGEFENGITTASSRRPDLLPLLRTISLLHALGQAPETAKDALRALIPQLAAHNEAQLREFVSYVMLRRAENINKAAADRTSSAKGAVAPRSDTHSKIGRGFLPAYVVASSTLSSLRAFLKLQSVGRFSTSGSLMHSGPFMVRAADATLAQFARLHDVVGVSTLVTRLARGQYNAASDVDTVDCRALVQVGADAGLTETGLWTDRAQYHVSSGMVATSSAAIALTQNVEDTSSGSSSSARTGSRGRRKASASASAAEDAKPPAWMLAHARHSRCAASPLLSRTLQQQLALPRRGSGLRTANALPSILQTSVTRTTRVVPRVHGGAAATCGDLQLTPLFPVSQQLPSGLVGSSDDHTTQRTTSFHIKQPLRYICQSGKFAALRSLLCDLQRRGRRALILTSSKPTAEAIDTFLASCAVVHSRLDHMVLQQSQLGEHCMVPSQVAIDRFNRDRRVAVGVLYVGALHGGAEAFSPTVGMMNSAAMYGDIVGPGLAITGADTIISFDVPLTDGALQNRLALIEKIRAARNTQLIQLVTDDSLEAGIMATVAATTGRADSQSGHVQDTLSAGAGAMGGISLGVAAAALSADSASRHADSTPVSHGAAAQLIADAYRNSLRGKPWGGSWVVPCAFSQDMAMQSNVLQLCRGRYLKIDTTAAPRPDVVPPFLPAFPSPAAAKYVAAMWDICLAAATDSVGSGSEAMHPVVADLELVMPHMIPEFAACSAEQAQATMQVATGGKVAPSGLPGAAHPLRSRMRIVDFDTAVETEITQIFEAEHAARAADAAKVFVSPSLVVTPKYLSELEASQFHPLAARSQEGQSWHSMLLMKPAHRRARDKLSVPVGTKLRNLLIDRLPTAYPVAPDDPLHREALMKQLEWHQDRHVLHFSKVYAPPNPELRTLYAPPCIRDDPCVAGVARLILATLDNPAVLSPVVADSNPRSERHPTVGEVEGLNGSLPPMDSVVSHGVQSIATVVKRPSQSMSAVTAEMQATAQSMFGPGAVVPPNTPMPWRMTDRLHKRSAFPHIPAPSAQPLDLASGLPDPSLAPPATTSAAAVPSYQVTSMASQVRTDAVLTSAGLPTSQISSSAQVSTSAAAGTSDARSSGTEAITSQIVTPRPSEPATPTAAKAEPENQPNAVVTTAPPSTTPAAAGAATAEKATPLVSADEAPPAFRELFERCTLLVPAKAIVARLGTHEIKVADHFVHSGASKAKQVEQTSFAMRFLQPYQPEKLRDPAIITAGAAALPGAAFAAKTQVSYSADRARYARQAIELIRCAMAVTNNQPTYAATGAWQEWEERMLLYAVKEFGTNWDMVRDLMRTHPLSRGRLRSARMCYDHHRKVTGAGRTKLQVQAQTKRKRAVASCLGEGHDGFVDGYELMPVTVGYLRPRSRSSGRGLKALAAVTNTATQADKQESQKPQEPADDSADVKKRKRSSDSGGEDSDENSRPPKPKVQRSSRTSARRSRRATATPSAEASESESASVSKPVTRRGRRRTRGRAAAPAVADEDSAQESNDESESGSATASGAGFSEIVAFCRNHARRGQKVESVDSVVWESLRTVVKLDADVVSRLREATLKRRQAVQKAAETVRGLRQLSMDQLGLIAAVTSRLPSAVPAAPAASEVTLTPDAVPSRTTLTWDAELWQIPALPVEDRLRMHMMHKTVRHAIQQRAKVPSLVKPDSNAAAATIAPNHESYTNVLQQQNIKEEPLAPSVISPAPYSVDVQAYRETAPYLQQLHNVRAKHAAASASHSNGQYYGGAAARPQGSGVGPQVR